MKYLLKQKNGGRNKILFYWKKIFAALPNSKHVNLNFFNLQKSKYFEFSNFTPNFNFIVSFKRYNKKKLFFIIKYHKIKAQLQNFRIFYLDKFIIDLINKYIFLI